MAIFLKDSLAMCEYSLIYLVIRLQEIIMNILKDLSIGFVTVKYAVITKEKPLIFNNKARLSKFSKNINAY